jgi:hypothetical protein
MSFLIAHIFFRFWQLFFLKSQKMTDFQYFMMQKNLKKNLFFCLLAEKYRQKYFNRNKMSTKTRYFLLKSCLIANKQLTLRRNTSRIYYLTRKILKK